MQGSPQHMPQKPVFSACAVPLVCDFSLHSGPVCLMSVGVQSDRRMLSFVWFFSLQYSLQEQWETGKVKVILLCL
jgi:hypothetical protein